MTTLAMFSSVDKQEVILAQKEVHHPLEPVLDSMSNHKFKVSSDLWFQVIHGTFQPLKQINMNKMKQSGWGHCGPNARNPPQKFYATTPCMSL